MGRDNARYARPCAIVVAQRRQADGALTVAVAPITHAAPGADGQALEIPAAVKRHLGLDESRSWIVVDEVNEFIWPGYDLAPDAGGQVAYGIIPDRLFQEIRRMMLECARTGGLDRVGR